MKTVSVRFTPLELQALDYLLRTYHAKNQSALLRRLLKDAAAARGFGYLRERPSRRVM